MPSNISITQDTANPYSESDIRYNYYNPLQVIAASNENISGGATQAQYYSSDGGGSWGQSSLPNVSGDSFQSDPCVDWTSDGTAWALTIGVNGSETVLIVRSFKSIDAGKTWKYDSDVSGSQTGTDKPSLWIDHSSTATKDNMYAIWHLGADTYVSVRKGTSGSWSVPLLITGAETTFTSDGSDIKTNLNGDVFAFWPNAGGNTMLMLKSTNGGTSFDALGAAPIQISTTIGSVLLGIPAQDVRGAFGIEGCLKYVSGGAYKTTTLDMVYACWADLAGGTGCNMASAEPNSDVTSKCKTRIWFAYSKDGGKTWQPAVKINDQSSLNDQFFPRLAVDDTTGNLMIVYYDTVADPGRLKTDVWMQCSADNGNTWTNAVKITSAETDEATADDDLGNQYGDYIGLSGTAGNFFACWTDRRSGGNEQIWGSAITFPYSYFIDVKNTFGVDEVNDSPSYSNDFYVAVEGASPNSLAGATPNLTNAFTGVAQIKANLTGGPLPYPTYELPAQLDTPQRILFPYNVSFPSGASIPPFPMPNGAAVLEELDSSIAFPGLTLSTQTLFELVGGADPYFANILPSADNEFYLSQDLRVFSITPGVPASANAIPGAPPFTPTVVGGTPIAFTAQDPTAGYNYIQSLLAHLNNNFNNPTPAGADPFAMLQNQGNYLTADSTVYPGTNNPGDPHHPFTNYNFAVARVRLTGKTGESANPVRVFFRLFISQTYDTSYQTSTAYPFNPDATGLPMSPLPGVANETYPFFATGDYSPATETSDYGTGGFNVRNISVGAADSGGVWAYFGCYLNVYNSSIQGAVMAAGTHQCLVAQIAYDGAPIENSSVVIESPENSDKLAQRNLQISFSDNPGPASTHRIPQAFDTQPSPLLSPLAGDLLEYPDEMMIAWGNTPIGSIASIYWPQVDASSVLQLASELYGSNFLSASDPHTLRCRVTGPVTYIPIPSGTGSNFAGLFTVDLPTTVVTGQEFSITVRRIATRRAPITPVPQGQALAVPAAAFSKRPISNWRYVVGTFAVRIPVSTKEVILWPELNALAILKWRLENMSLSNRWYPVLHRLVEITAGRVQGFGVNPNQIPPSWNGYAPPATGREPGGGHHDKHHYEVAGKVVGIVYNRFGDFVGFRLITEHGHERSFRGREREMEALVYRAWEEEILVTLRLEEPDSDWPSTIIYRRP